MQKLFRCGIVLMTLAASASVSAAGELKLTLDNGRATLIAQDVPLRQILDEWARVGKTTIVNGDKLAGPPITVQLIDRPEAEVLEVLLRSASGYIAAPRDAAAAAGPSIFAKVMILPVSRGPVGVAGTTPPPTFGPRPNPITQPMPMPVSDDDDNDAPQILPPGMGPQPQALPTPFQAQPGQTPVPNPNLPPTGAQPQLTAPRPGMLPAPPAAQPNPYGAPIVQPGVIRPPGGRGGPGVPNGPGGID
jgi:hypothetical protein